MSVRWIASTLAALHAVASSPLVKASVIKGVCRGAGITLTPPFTGDVGVALSVGTTDRYCAQFGGKSVKNATTLTKRKKAAAPGSCPP